MNLTERLRAASDTYSQGTGLGLKARFSAARGVFSDLGNMGKAGGAPSDMKAAYNTLPVGVQGRPQRPASNIPSLYKAHRTNELAYSCIRAIATAASDPEPVVERRNDKNEWVPDETHPARRLLLWPNPQMDGATFMQRLLTSAQITGYFYAEIVRDGLDLPDQLWPLDPTKLAPVPGINPDGSNVTGYEFREGAHREFIPARNMIAYKLPNPASQFQALSPLEVAIGSVDADSAQTDYVRAFFNGGGAPTGILKIKAKLNDEQVRAIQRKWLAKYGRRGTMQEAPAVLDDTADYQKIGSNLDEIESDSLRGQTEARICGAFGVPPILVGAYVALMYTNQRASVREAQQDFWQNTMSPMFRLLRLFFTIRLLSEYEGIDLIKADRVRMGWNMQHVAGMQEDKDGVHTRARADFAAGGLTWNEYRVKIGEAPDQQNGGFIVLPRSLAPTTIEKALAQATSQQVTPTPPVPTTGTGGSGGPAGEEQGGEGTGDAGQGKRAVNPSGAPEVKAYSFEGLDLRREPTDIERKAGLPSIVRAMDAGAGRLKKALLGIREAMIADAVADLQQIDEGDEHTLALEITAAHLTRVRASLEDSFGKGRDTVSRSLEQQQAASKGLHSDTSARRLKAAGAKHTARLDALASATLTKLANDVQARAVGRLSELVLLGLDRADADASATKARPKSFWRKLEEDLKESSTQYADRAASGSTNAALSLGREAEAEEWGSDIKQVVYSAVLDNGTCGICEDADGEEGASGADLPAAPNPACEGGSQCRCIHIYVLE